jgi:hypothetical protein
MSGGSQQTSLVTSSAPWPPHGGKIRRHITTIPAPPPVVEDPLITLAKTGVWVAAATVVIVIIYHLATWDWAAVLNIGGRY